MMRPHAGPILLVVIASACWATSGLWISRVLAQGANTSAGLAFWRDAVTFGVLLAAMAISRPRDLRVRRRDLPWLAAMGVISIGLFHVMWNLTVVLNGIAIATVLQYNSVILVPVAAWLLWREPLTRRKIAAALLALTGTILIAGLTTGGNVPLSTTGLLIGLASACAYSGLSIFGKRLTGAYSGWTVLTYAFGFGALPLLIWQLVVGGPEPLPALTWPPFAVLILVTIGGFGLYGVALQHLQAGVAAIVATSEVFFAAIVAYAVMGERLGLWQVVGATLIVAGVLILAWGQTRWARSERVPQPPTAQELARPAELAE